MSDVKMLFLDIQTTGLKPLLNEIIEISALLEVNGKLTSSFHAKGRPANIETTFAPEALQAQNLTIKDLLAYPDRLDFFNKFAEFLNKNVNTKDSNDYYILAVYNESFIKDFLFQFFKEQKNFNFGNYFFKYSLDIMDYAKIYFFAGRLITPDLKFINVCKAKNIELKEYSSIEKVKALYKLYKALDSKIMIID